MSTLATNKKDDYIPLLESSRYSVKGLLGVGAFGYVYECIRSDTNEVVAAKFIPKYQAKFGQNEVYNLQRLRKFDPDTVNLVRFKHNFKLGGHVILEFEILDMSVMDLFERLKKPFKLSEIQMMTQQMLVALNTLRGIGMIHTDIKLDNIMLVNHELHPFKVKLIDFGLACDVRGLCLGDILYIPEHRAPEIYLGLHLNEAVDMWALGCVMVSLYINANLFSGKCRLGTMEEMVQWIGQPDDQLLNTGLYTLNYFYRKKDTWKLKLECTCSTGNNSLSSFSSYETVPAHEPLNSMSLRQFTCLKDIVMTHSQVALYEDTQAFINFLVQILQVDPQKRISPSEALMHPFITMEHFPSDLINDSPNQIKASACTPTRRTATGRENRPERHFLLASLEDALGRTSIISESLAFFGDNTDEDTTGSKFKAKKWFFRKINRFVSWLFKKAPFTNRFVDSSVQEETFACNNGKQLSTAILDKVVTICTNEEPTAAFDRTTEKSTSKASTAILDGPVTICANAEPTTAGSADNRPTAISDDAVTNDGLIAAADKAPVASDNTHSNEEPSTSAPTTFLNEPVTIHINNGSSVTTDKTTAILDTNDGPTDAADRTAAGSVSRPRNRNPSPSVLHCGLTSLVDRISDGNNKRPSDEKPSPTAVFNTNDGLTAAAERTTDANNRPSNKNGSMMDPLLQLSKLTPTAICCVPTAAVDRSTFTNNNRPNDEEPSQTTAASDRTSAGSDKRPSDVNPSPAAIIDGASMICTNNRRTATADSVTSPGDENPSHKTLTDAASRTCAGSDNRPSNERPLPTVNLDEACDNSPQGRVNSVETSFASVGHGSKEVEGSTAGSKIKLNKQFLKRIHRYFIGLLKKGPFTYCLNVSDNKESSATSNENRSPTAITHETCDNRACGKTS